MSSNLEGRGLSEFATLYILEFFYLACLVLTEGTFKSLELRLRVFTIVIFAHMIVMRGKQTGVTPLDIRHVLARIAIINPNWYALFYS